MAASSRLQMIRKQARAGWSHIVQEEVHRLDDWLKERGAFLEEDSTFLYSIRLEGRPVKQ